MKNVSLHNNNSWKGGVIIKNNGYRYKRVLNHPRVKGSSGYVAEHVLIMEQHIGRYLEPDEVVHHIDGDKLNNVISNLQLLTRKEHAHLHGKVKKVAYARFRCPVCKKEFEREKRKSHLSKKDNKVTCCSRTCSASLSHKKADYSDNVIEIFYSKLARKLPHLQCGK